VFVCRGCGFSCVQIHSDVVYTRTVSCFEVKTEADSDDDIIECLHDDKPTIGTPLCFSLFSSVTLHHCRSL